MQMIISPAKKMRVDLDSFPIQGIPQFMPETEELLQRLRQLDRAELKALWKCSDALVDLNRERLQHMNLYRNLTPAILSYEGIQYQYMAPNVFDEQALTYIQQHLRILSGFYGVVRPFDGVTPYRLEMQAKLNICKANSLYSYWGNRLAESICRETDCIINLASKEYSVCISKYLPAGVRMITCTFGERKNGKIIEKGTMCKMARGDMVRYLATSGAQTPEEVKTYRGMNYQFSSEESDDQTFVFLKEE